MKRGQFLMIVCFAGLQACDFVNPKLDVKEARRPVYLSSKDLEVFSQFRQQLIADSSAIRAQAIRNGYSRHWMHTDSYYLDKIDSLSYKKFYSKLNGKIAGEVYLDGNGDVMFTIKENIQMNYGDYNETYTHSLVYSVSDFSVEDIFNDAETVYIDSVIKGNWRYHSAKYLTGH